MAAVLSGLWWMLMMRPSLLESMLAEALPRRWRHVRSVARRARWVAKKLSLSDDLVAAAWLHDIGTPRSWSRQGFHPLDGARYLRRFGVDDQVVSLVAYHSCAQIEAEVRGLGADLASEFLPGIRCWRCAAVLRHDDWAGR